MDCPEIPSRGTEGERGALERDHPSNPVRGPVQRDSPSRKRHSAVGPASRALLGNRYRPASTVRAATVCTGVCICAVEAQVTRKGSRKALCAPAFGRERGSGVRVPAAAWIECRRRRVRLRQSPNCGASDAANDSSFLSSPGRRPRVPGGPREEASGRGVERSRPLYSWIESFRYIFRFRREIAARL
jgi:hypothetical protein